MNYSYESENPVNQVPQKDLVLFDRIIQSAESCLNFGILAKGNEIPIIFVTEKTMDRASQELRETMFREEMNDSALFEKWKNIHERPDAEIWQYEGWLKEDLWSRVDFLGFFVSDKTIRRKGPEVWVCYDKICKYNYDSTVCRNKTLEVLIHELGHAVMYNSRTTGIFSLNEWVEEPLANMIALKYISTAMSSAQTNGDRQVLQDALESSRSSMGRQSPNYRLGLDLFDAEQNGITFSWKEWCNCKNYLNQKKKELLAWRAYVEKSKHSYVNQAQLDPANLYALYQEIVKPVQNVQQPLTQGNNDNMGNELRALIYYVLYAVRIANQKIDPDQDYHDTLAAHEQMAKAIFGNNLVNLADIHKSQECFREIYEQILNGQSPETISVRNPGVVNAQPVSCFEKYVNGLNETSTRRSVEQTMDRINEILAGRIVESVDENGNNVQVRENPKERVNGLVVGRVQSGKTRNYVGLMLKAFECGWNAIIVLTSNSTNLRKQTVERIQEDFAKSGVNDGCSRFVDFSSNEAALIPANAMQNYFYWGVVIKQPDNVDRLKRWLTQSARVLSEMRIMIIDDEADNVSPNTNNGRDLLSEEEIDAELEKFEDLADVTADVTISEKYQLLLNWFQYLRTLSADHAIVVQFNEILAANAAKAASQLNALINGRWLGLENEYEDVKELLTWYYHPGKTKPTISDLIKLLKSIFNTIAERSTINKAINEIVGMGYKQTEYTYNFRNLAYVAYTATPYACILNENPTQTFIYPDFIQSLDKSNQYFGLAEIFGEFDQNNLWPRMSIVHTYDTDEQQIIDHVKNGKRISDDLNVDNKDWTGIKNAIAYFVCTAAARRFIRLRDKPNSEKRDDLWTSMLVHLSHKIEVAEQLKDAITSYLRIFLNSQNFLVDCQTAWQNTIAELNGVQFCQLFPNYGNFEQYPTWNDLIPHVNYFSQNGRIQVIVLNTGNDGVRDSHLYENDGGDQKMPLPILRDDRAWIVCGGNKIARGLTLPGLTVSYFDRLNKTIPVDTMTQMGRWFGYRQGYELLPRIWMQSDNLTMFKKTATIEELLHKDVRANFDTRYSPADPNHYQRIYSFGRKLSGRAQSQQVVDRKVSTLIHSKGLPINAADVRSAYDIVNNFATTHQAKLRSADYEYANIPLWENVSTTDIEDLLNSIKTYYPQNTRQMIGGLLKDIQSSINQEWDVVLGTPQAHVLNAPTPTSFNFGNFALSGATPSLVRTATSLETSTTRLPVSFYANFPTSVLDETTNYFKDYFANNHPEKIPQGAQLPEGYRNRSDSEYMARAFENLPGEASKKPVLQFYIIDPQGNVDGLNAGIPLIAVSAYWPKHQPDFYEAISVGYEPPRRPITSIHVFSKVTRILRDYGFPMNTNELRARFLECYPTILFPNADVVYNAQVNRGENNGFAYYKVPGKDAYAPTNWASKAQAEELLKLQFTETSVDVLRQSTNGMTFDELKNAVIIHDPKWDGLILFTNPGAFVTYINQRPEYNLITEGNRPIRFAFNREGL